MGYFNRYTLAPLISLFFNYLVSFSSSLIRHIPERTLSRDQIIEIAKALCYPPKHKLQRLLQGFDPGVGPADARSQDAEDRHFGNLRSGLRQIFRIMNI